MCSGPGLGCLSLLEQQKEPCQLLKEVLLYNAVNLTYSSLWDLTQVSQRSILFSTDSFICFLLKRSITNEQGTLEAEGYHTLSGPEALASHLTLESPGNVQVMCA